MPGCSDAREMRCWAARPTPTAPKPGWQPSPRSVPMSARRSLPNRPAALGSIRSLRSRSAFPHNGIVSGPWFVGGIEHNEILRRVGNASNECSWPRALAAVKPLPSDRITVSWQFLNISRSGPARRVPRSGTRMNPRQNPPTRQPQRSAGRTAPVSVGGRSRRKARSEARDGQATVRSRTHHAAMVRSQTAGPHVSWILRKERPLGSRMVPTRGSGDKESTDVELGVRPIVTPKRR